MALIEVEAGGYRAVPGVFQYSAGVAAMPGYAIRRVRFRTVVPLAEGFDRIERIMAEAGRPATAFCACELRSPAPFTDTTFRAFNERYVERLAKWGLFDGTTNSVARSNVCPELDPPSEPGVHAFCFTVEDAEAAPTFAIAGSGESREGFATYEEATVRFGETSTDAMTEKARYVLDEMERRMAALGFGWADASAAQAYTVHDLHPFLGSEIVRRGAATGGLTWHYCRPPVVGLEYEMDCRHVAREDII